MPGEADLATLLRAMRPVLHPDPFTFRTVAGRAFAALPALLLGSAWGLFREAEGITVIVPAAEADISNPDGAWALITLSIHSDLNAVGFLAALTARLADAGISVNAVSAYYHDHLFVPWDKRERAMQILAAPDTGKEKAA